MVLSILPMKYLNSMSLATFKKGYVRKFPLKKGGFRQGVYKLQSFLFNFASPNGPDGVLETPLKSMARSFLTYTVDH